MKTGKRIAKIGDELDAVLAADLNPQQTLVALGGPNRTVRIYSTETGEQLHEIKKHTDWVYGLQFSPDGVLLASCDRSGGVFVWEADTAPARVVSYKVTVRESEGKDAKGKDAK